MQDGRAFFCKWGAAGREEVRNGRFMYDGWSMSGVRMGWVHVRRQDADGNRPSRRRTMCRVRVLMMIGPVGRVGWVHVRRQGADDDRPSRPRTMCRVRVLMMIGPVGRVGSQFDRPRSRRNIRDLAPILVSTPFRAETIARQASCAKNQPEVQ